MLHSYSGSPEQVQQLTGIGRDAHGDLEPVGRRLYFSFSAALAHPSLEKTKERMCAVLDDRILIETDLEQMGEMNDALADIVRIVADAKGWTVDETVDKTWANFLRFYDGFLPQRDGDNSGAA
jgi:Tat protein secretion system quality control protein TatD with DNase activity